MIRCVESLCGKHWMKGNVLHRDNDLPAIEVNTGAKYWYVDGKRHRAGEPARIDTDGSMWWYEDDLSHRVGGPAIIRSGVSSSWIVRGKLHRVEGPAIVDVSGDEHWYLNGERHRSDGFALQFNSASIHQSQWFLHGVGVYEQDVVAYGMKEIYETALVMLSVDLPPYCLLWILEYVNAMIAVKKHRETIRLLEGLCRSRSKIKPNTNTW